MSLEIFLYGTEVTAEAELGALLGRCGVGEGLAQAAAASVIEMTVNSSASVVNTVRKLSRGQLTGLNNVPARIVLREKMIDAGVSATTASMIAAVTPADLIEAGSASKAHAGPMIRSALDSMDVSAPDQAALLEVAKHIDHAMADGLQKVRDSIKMIMVERGVMPETAGSIVDAMPDTIIARSAYDAESVATQAALMAARNVGLSGRVAVQGVIALRRLGESPMVQSTIAEMASPAQEPLAETPSDATLQAAIHGNAAPAPAFYDDRRAPSDKLKPVV